MTKQTIFLGTISNDGTGDTLKQAGQKINDNFDEVYTLTDAVVGINRQEGTSYTLVDSDNGKLITLDNAGAIAVTIPEDFPTGWRATLAQIGAGTVTVTPTAPELLNGAGGGVSTTGQWSDLRLTKFDSEGYIGVV